MSRDEADRIADQILHQAKLANRGHRTPVHTSIPLLCRCRELRALPQRVQLEVIREARHEVTRNPVYVLLGLAWIVLIVALWIFVVAPLRRASLITPLIGISWINPFLVREWLLRRRVQMIALERQSLALISDQ